MNIQYRLCTVRIESKVSLDENYDGEMWEIKKNQRPAIISYRAE